MNTKITVILTTYNEARTIEALLRSLLQQTLPPSQIVIVDAGSSDQTVEIIERLKKEQQLPIRVMVKRGVNRSRGRNLAIEEAEHDIIAVTDAGCVPQKDWVEKLTAAFFDDRQADVVAGWYSISTKNDWQRVISVFTATQAWQFNTETFLPSSRSVAFTKTIWQQVEGYPEHLAYCEDLIFAEKLKKAAQHWVVEPEAKVRWSYPKTVRELQDRVFHYALGDLQAKYERHVKKIHAAIWRMGILLFFALPGLFLGIRQLLILPVGLLVLYVFGSLWKHRRVITRPQSLFYIVLLQLVVDLSLVHAWIFYRLTRLSKLE